jgi:hypothetical protein
MQDAEHLGNPGLYSSALRLGKYIYLYVRLGNLTE